MVVAEGVARLPPAGGDVGVKKIIFIAPSSGTGDVTFLPVRRIEITMITRRSIPMMMPVAATVLVRSSIPLQYYKYYKSTNPTNE